MVNMAGVVVVAVVSLVRSFFRSLRDLLICADHSNFRLLCCTILRGLRGRRREREQSEDGGGAEQGACVIHRGVFASESSKLRVGFTASPAKGSSNSSSDSDGAEAGDGGGGGSVIRRPMQSNESGGRGRGRESASFPIYGAIHK